MPKLLPKDLEKIASSFAKKGGSKKPAVIVHTGTCGIAAGANKVKDTLLSSLSTDKIVITTTGCAGLCSMEPMVTVNVPGQDTVVYVKLTEKKVKKVIEHIQGGNPVDEYALKPDLKQAFYGKQQTVVLKNRGVLDPEDIEAYIAMGGYAGLAKALLKMKPAEIVQQVKKSGLRGRGGGGFPTGTKWELCSKSKSKEKYVICNGDEGDPGAYMDRSIIESDPHALIEGMIIGARAMGAHEGLVYLRSEYPLAHQQLGMAIEKAREHGLLGKDILGSGFDFDLTIFRGAGAFVCGEETSLIASLEGRSPEPSIRPPYPTESGLWGKPTNINNVETWANVPQIIQNGADWYAGIGTETSKGTKVFSLVGNVQFTGLVEVPMGLTLREIIFDVGGGIPKNKKFKAVQTGGPSGGCIPADHLDLPIDYEKLAEVGSIMGSGGMIVMDENTCMVDVARYFLDFLQDESCGKCISCREGTQVMYEILTRICEGHGKPGDIELLEDIADGVQSASMCGLGTTAPNPVLSTIKYFRDEYEAHIDRKTCPGGVCKPLIQYRIDGETCTGCTLCAKSCPVSVIEGARKKAHAIQIENCIKCGACREVCPVDAVLIESAHKAPAQKGVVVDEQTMT